MAVAGDECGCNRPVSIYPLVIAAACRYLGIDEKEPARRFYVDRSAISGATLRISRNPKLPAATKTIQ
ncbi:MAG: hypothetical protein WBM78_25115 [Desulfobacterales bacterium]